jgi:transcriptional regulator GlxA family with amidase domain
MRKIVITGQSPLQILDVTGPLEVFSNVADYEVVLGSPDGGDALRTNRHVSLTPAVPLADLHAPIDTLVIAGGPGAESGRYDGDLLAWVRMAAERSRRIAAVCTGAFPLAAAGLLDGKQVVTHWNFCDQFAREFPATNVKPDPIFLRDGNVYTSAGITAGIDLALALVEEDHGHQVALDVARQLVMFLVRPGGQAQFSHMLSRQAVTSKPLRELQVWMMEHLRDDLTVERLAERMDMSSRHFTRTCLRETKMNPGQFVDRLRVEAAQQLIAASDMGLKEVADACGFRTPDAMRRTFIRVLGVTAGEYGRRFGRRPDGE